MRRLRLTGLAAASGLLLFLADFPVHAFWLQAVALVPLLAGLLREARSARDAALAGLVTGLVNLVPLALVLGFPPLMAAGLGLYLTLIWVLLALGARWTLRLGPPPLGALATGALAVLVEWLDFNALPVWGTAQSFVRVWSAAPQAVQVVALGGMLLLVFVLVAGQALLASLIVERGGRRAHALALASLLLGLALHGWLSSPAGGERGLRVAAIGWTEADLPAGSRTAPAELLEQVYRPLALDAARRGARLVVSPEVGFVLGASERAPILAALGQLAREQRVMLAVGYFDLVRDDNRVALIDGDGVPVGEYVKTHLIPLLERYRAGEGRLLVRGGPGPRGLRIGAMICQDDNFTDLARAYGRLAVDLVVVPTNDWRQVKDYHLENSIFRALEHRYGVVRAASNGVSAIIAPGGALLARADHFHEGARAIVADLPARPSVTPYSRYGDWPALVSLFALALALALPRRVR